MKRVLLAGSALVAAVAVAVPAAMATTFTVRAGGLVFDNPSGGTVQTLGKFALDFRKGPGHKVVYTNATTGLSFHSLSIASVRFNRNAVEVTGLGLANGKRVHFTAIAADHATGMDAFKISWNHLAAHGGNVLNGNVRITPISAG